MIEIRKKGLKPYLIKYLALLIGFCYLAHPFHYEIGAIFHEISHLISPPNNILSNLHFFDQDNNKHYYHEHNLSFEEHDHKVIDLFEFMFNASDSDKQGNDSLHYYDEIDKHLTANYSTLTKRTLVITRINYKWPIKRVRSGHIIIKKKPPQIYLS